MPTLRSEETIPPELRDMTSTAIDPQDIYGLVSPQMFIDPHPLYHMLRYADPVHWSEVLGAWVLTRYDDVLACLKDERLSNAARRKAGSARLSPEMREHMKPVDRHLEMWVLNLDGEEHRALRSILIKTFTPRAVESLQPAIRGIVEELIVDLAGRDEIDFIADFARPLPVRVLAHMLGIPRPHLPLLGDWAAKIGTFFALGPSRTEIVDDMARTLEEMGGYMAGLVDRARRDRPDTMLRSMVEAADESGNVSEEQLLATCVMLVFAGHDSTVNLIGTALYSLLRNPDQAVLLRNNPSLIGTAVHEFLRFESPVMRHDRIALEDFTLDGRHIEAGQRLVLALGAANRDPAHYPLPDALDITRPNNRHLSLGYGPHACLGMALTQAQAGAGLQRFIEIYPSAHPAAPAVWRQHFNFRGFSKLPLVLR